MGEKIVTWLTCSMGEAEGGLNKIKKSKKETRKHHTSPLARTAFRERKKWAPLTQLVQEGKRKKGNKKSLISLGDSQRDRPAAPQKKQESIGLFAKKGKNNGRN